MTHRISREAYFGQYFTTVIAGSTNTTSLADGKRLEAHVIPVHDKLLYSVRHKEDDFSFETFEEAIRKYNSIEL